MKLYLFGILAVSLALTPGAAYAYIDPGSASLFITLVIGILAGAAMAIRTYWTRLKSFFSGGTKNRPADDDPED
jgi:hypothetical protein